MKLYIVRHGEALTSEMDPKRPLSEDGRAQVSGVAQHLQEENAHPHRIYHSGVLRAQQTAEILSEILKVGQVEKITDFTPEDPVEPMLQHIASWTQDTMLVGHLPYVSVLLSRLSEEGHYVEFDTATAVCLEKAANQWLIRAVLAP